LNQSALKLRERRKEMEDELTRGCRRINGVVAQRANPDLPLEQFLNQGRQMGHGPPEAIEAPDHQRVAWS
jgi:hypothetical protein